MANVVTRLGYLMEVLDVTGKELAFAIKTDTTTISKLKKGQRKLNYNSKYTKAIVEYFLLESSTLKRSKLIKFMKNYEMDLEAMEEEEQIDHLRDWIVQEIDEKLLPNTGKEHVNVNAVAMYEGLEGWRKANTTFWETALMLRPGERVYVGDFGDVDWKQMPKEDIDRCVNYLIRIMKKGIKVIIIDKVTDNYKPYETLLRWLPAYLQANVEVLYFQKELKEFYKQSIYVAGNKIAFIGCLGSDSQVGALYTLHYSENAIGFYKRLIMSIENKAEKLIHSIPVSDIGAMQALLNNNFKTGHMTYMINRMPSYRNMPEALLVKILQENDVNPELIETFVGVNRHRKEMRSSHRYRQIYDMDAMEAAFTKPGFVEYDLSRAVGKEIYITKEDFLEQLTYIAQTTSTDIYQLVCTSFQKMHLNPGGSSLIVQDDSIMVAWDCAYYSQCIYSTELTAVGGYFNYLQSLWDDIPLICKNDDWTKKQLERLIKAN